MGEIVEAVLLGIVQGLTEFLPVSSSGHIEIMKYILNDDAIAEQSMMTTVFLHFATAISTIIVFRKDIVSLISRFLRPQKSSDRLFIWYILISMIPAVCIGLGFENLIETFFHRKIMLVGSMLIVTGIILYLSQRVVDTTKPIDSRSAFIIGIAQAIAILPGISRSGATIGTALLLNTNREAAARFSFLMVVPLIFGKIAKDLISGDMMLHMPSSTYLVAGFLSALITGILACSFMIRIVKRAKLDWFAGYCLLAGFSIIVFTLIK